MVSKALQKVTSDLQSFSFSFECCNFFLWLNDPDGFLLVDIILIFKTTTSLQETRNSSVLPVNRQQDTGNLIHTTDSNYSVDALVREWRFKPIVGEFIPTPTHESRTSSFYPKRGIVCSCLLYTSRCV